MITHIRNFVAEKRDAQSDKDWESLPSDVKDSKVYNIIKDSLHCDSGELARLVTTLWYKEKIDDDRVVKVVDKIADYGLCTVLSVDIDRYEKWDDVEHDVEHPKDIPIVSSFFSELIPELKQQITRAMTRHYLLSIVEKVPAFMSLPKEVRQKFTNNKVLAAMEDPACTDYTMQSVVKNRTTNASEEFVRNVISQNRNGSIEVKYDRNGIVVVRINSKSDAKELLSEELYDWVDRYITYIGPLATMYVVFNFNVCVSCAMSSFFVPIKPSGECDRTACVNTRGGRITLDEVITLLDVPAKVFSPDELTSYLSSISDNLKSLPNLVEMSMLIRKGYDTLTTNDLKTIGLYVNKNGIVTTNKVVDTFKDKTLKETKEIIKDKIVSVLVSIGANPTEVSASLVASLDRDVCHYLLFRTLKVLRSMHRPRTSLSGITPGWNYIESAMETSNNEVDPIVIRRNLTIDKSIDEKLFQEATMGKVQDISINDIKEIFDETKEKIIDSLKEGKLGASFKQYKAFYDTFVAPEEDTRYEEIPYDVLFDRYEDDLELVSMIEQHLRRLIGSKEEEDAAALIVNLIQLPDSNEEFRTADDSNMSVAVIDVLEKLNAVDSIGKIVADESTLSGLFLYKETKDETIGQVLKNKMDIKTDSNGNDYVAFSEFTDLDFMFDVHCFSWLNDYDFFQWYELDDYSLKENASMLDGQNTLMIADEILDICSECDSDIDRKTVAKYYNRMWTLSGVYNNNEVNELMEQVLYVLFDKDDFSEQDEQTEINDRIIRETIYRASMTAEESALHDELFSTCCKKVRVFLTGDNNNSCAKWVNGGEGLGVYVDLYHLVADLGMSFESFYDYYGNSPSINDLIEFLVEQEGYRIDIEYELEDTYASVSKEKFNDVIRNI